MKKKIFGIILTMILLPCLIMVTSCKEKNELKTISVNEQESVLSFYEGQFTPSSIVIDLHYSNGEIKKINVTEEMLGDKKLEVGENTLTITYLGLSCNVSIKILKIYQYTEGLKFKLLVNYDQYEVIGYDGKDTNVIIPLKYNDKYVISIGNSAFENSNIINIEIPESVTSVGYGAFKNSPNLQRIILPTNLRSIGDAAFYNCVSMQTLFIPKSVTHIGQYAATSVKNIYMEAESVKESYHDGWFDSKYSYIYFEVKQSDIVLDESFEYLLRDGSYHLVSYYGANTEVVVKEELSGIAINAIGAQAFAYDVDIQKVTLSKNISILMHGAFKQCEALTEVVMEETIKYIYEFAFSYCKSLSSFTILKNDQIVYNDNYFHMPEGLLSIDDTSFNFCEGLINVVLPSTLEKIGPNTFSWCTFMEKIFIPKSVTYIGTNGFYACSKLTICAEVSDIQPGWQENWNISSRPIKFNCTQIG